MPDRAQEKIDYLTYRPFKFKRLTYVILLMLLVIWPIGTGILQSRNIDKIHELLTNPSLQVYLPTMIIQILILVIVLLAVRHETSDLRSIGYGSFTLDKLMIGLAFFVGARLVLVGIAYTVSHLGLGDFRDPSYLLPENLRDKAMWTALAVIVAFSEETAFRGYALTRLSAVVGSRTITVIIVSAAFSLGHLYQGVGGVIVIFFYSLMFSMLFYWTKSIWPGIVAHFLQDFTPIFAIEAIKDIQG